VAPAQVRTFARRPSGRVERIALGVAVRGPAALHNRADRRRRAPQLCRQAMESYGGAHVVAAGAGRPRPSATPVPQQRLPHRAWPPRPCLRTPDDLYGSGMAQAPSQLLSAVHPPRVSRLLAGRRAGSVRPGSVNAQPEAGYDRDFGGRGFGAAPPPYATDPSLSQQPARFGRRASPGGNGTAGEGLEAVARHSSSS
jgi:hypothetical protein